MRRNELGRVGHRAGVALPFALAFAAVMFSVAAVERTYVGTNRRWNVADNWDPSGIPEAGDTAKFTTSISISESIALPAGVMTIHNTVDTLTLNGVISGEGAVLVHQGKALALGSNNTFTGAFTNLSGNVTAPALANGGRPSLFGAGYGPICFRDGQITVQNNCSTDRHIHYWEGKGGNQFNVASGKTLTLTGGFHGGMWQRGGGTIKFNCHLDTSVDSMGRTDSGAFYFNGPTNTFTATPNLANGAFYYCSLSNKNVACALGAGTALQFGQSSWDTPGTFSYTGDVDVMCDRDIRIYSADGSNSSGGHTGAYSKYDGPYFETQRAGVKQTFTGTIVLGNAKAVSPFIKFKGAGDGEITTSIPHRFHVCKEGSGTWTLSGQNAATGRLELAVGRLNINGSYAEGATITVANSATLGGTGVVHCAATFSAGAILAPGTATECGALTFDGAAPSFHNGSKINIKVGDGTNDVVNVNGTPAVDGTVTVTLSMLGGGIVPDGRYTIMTYAARPTATFILEGTDGLLTLQDNALVVTVGTPALVWQGDDAENVWDTATANWSGGSLYSDGDDVLFDDSGSASPSIMIPAGGVRPGLVMLKADTKEYAFSGGPIAGEAIVVKDGDAALTVSNDWTFAGAFQANGGVTTLAGNFNGPSIIAGGAASIVQTPTSMISGENIEVFLAHGNHALRGTNDFTGSIMLDVSSYPANNYKSYIFNARTFGYATNVTVVPKYVGSEQYTYLWWSNSCDIAKETALSVHRFPETRWAALDVPESLTGGWLGDIRAVGSGTNPGFAFYTYYVGPSRLNVGTLGETEVAGFGEIRCRGGGGIHFYSRFDSPGTLLAPNDGTAIYFYAPGNLIGTLSLVFGRAVMMTNNAFAASTSFGLGKDSQQWGGGHWADLNLNGTTQTVASVNENHVGKGGYRRITSTLPATLVVSGAVNCAFGSASAYGNGYITGAVSLVKDGTSTWTLNGTNSFTGTVEVRGGTLAANCAKALPESTSVVIGAADGSAGVLKLDVDQTVQYLWIGGQCRQKGVYGGPESSAPRKLSCLSGSATLTVLHDKGGTLMIFR